MRPTSSILVSILIAVAGFGLGVAYGRLIAPVEFVDTDPSALRVDYRSDYILMVAERYAADRDANEALRRVALLGALSPERMCAEAIQFAQSAPYAPEDMELMQQLLRAVQEQTLAPSSGESP
jgi:hypothetical protein